MTKKRKPNYRGGRAPRFSFEFFDAWLAANADTGIGKEAWAELNYQKYKMNSASALKQQLIRMQKRLDDLQ